MKLYYPKSHYNLNYRGQTFPLLKPFIKSEEFIDAERQVGYGNFCWKHVVWIDTEELDAIGERVLAFHHALTAESFKKLQKRNRKLWEEKLRLKGFFEQSI
ncbi:hypothetical protein [Formosa sp. A9]|uniref:hypothetical protein n=1 Tax=Formosa sp. A9 TaxID=3442641 RepID=UPI003EBE3D5C